MRARDCRLKYQVEQLLGVEVLLTIFFELHSRYEAVLLPRQARENCLKKSLLQATALPSSRRDRQHGEGGNDNAMMITGLLA